MGLRSGPHFLNSVGEFVTSGDSLDDNIVICIMVVGLVCDVACHLGSGYTFHARGFELLEGAIEESLDHLGVPSGMDNTDAKVGAWSRDMTVSE